MVSRAAAASLALLTYLRSAVAGRLVDDGGAGSAHRKRVSHRTCRRARALAGSVGPALDTPPGGRRKKWAVATHEKDAEIAAYSASQGLMRIRPKFL